MTNWLSILVGTVFVSITILLQQLLLYLILFERIFDFTTQLFQQKGHKKFLIDFLNPVFYSVDVQEVNIEASKIALSVNLHKMKTMRKEKEQEL